MSRSLHSELERCGLPHDDESMQFAAMAERTYTSAAVDTVRDVLKLVREMDEAQANGDREAAERLYNQLLQRCGGGK
jgi:hypothetical protein